ncbi:MAG: ribonuclease PH [Sphaerobacteraceae bacterium]|nr:MAG: ribonuclease PH [Sphaerobacteraceae bacterium]
MAEAGSNARPLGRPIDQMRPVSIEPDFAPYAEGSALIQMGETHVLCTATVEESTAPFLVGSGQGWVTAEYGMLPRSSPVRIPRSRSASSGRTKEIQRLIGRSLRAAVDLNALGERSVIIDCDVLRADGGTRTASITGGYVALHMALQRVVQRGLLAESPITCMIGAVSAGVVAGEVRLDLEYVEDSTAAVDLNVVMTDALAFVELQATAEDGAYTHEQLNEMLRVSQSGIEQLFAMQRAVLGI